MGSAAIYDYTPTQLTVVELHNHYRTALMNAKYYSRQLEWYKGINTWADVIVALATSSGFAGLAIWKNPVGANIPSALLAASALIAALRPIFRLSDRIDRYGKLHYGYLELYYRIDALISDMRGMSKVTDEHRQKASDLAERFRALELEGDAYQNPKKLLSIRMRLSRPYRRRNCGYLANRRERNVPVDSISASLASRASPTMA